MFDVSETIKRIINIINKICNYNKLQKFYADLTNTICNDVIKINIKKYNYRENEYLFNF